MQRQGGARPIVRLGAVSGGPEIGYTRSMEIFEYLAIAAVLAVAVILAVGVISMITGGAFGKRNSNRLMRARILFQALAIVFLALVFLTGD
ncbi:MAG: hypothetical protein DHS20C03_02520 [Minwuia thermotolerans]|nr:MAG: hypothetical protein DHS20C03_02520 [Minwuia thermotolerans]